MSYILSSALSSIKKKKFLESFCRAIQLLQPLSLNSTLASLAISKASLICRAKQCTTFSMWFSIRKHVSSFMSGWHNVQFRNWVGIHGLGRPHALGRWPNASLRVTGKLRGVPCREGKGRPERTKKQAADSPGKETQVLNYPEGRGHLCGGTQA